MALELFIKLILLIKNDNEVVPLEEKGRNRLENKESSGKCSTNFLEKEI